MAKRHQRHAAPPRQTRTRTRQNRGAGLVSDPIKNTQLLNDQLRALGLYAAPTLGDGNCLFRALSDQFYGTSSQHLKLRDEICGWMETHKQRYAPFVDDERGLDVHIRCMRQPGTYGGHLELTAFAHLKRRDVKVIQPGLVYVIEWAAGADLSPTSPVMPEDVLDLTEDNSVNERDTRRIRREKKREIKEKSEKNKRAVDVGDDSDTSNNDVTSLGAVYVAYHDWEHFSSVRNLTGPHSGLPYVVEKPAPSASGSNRTSITKSKAKTVIMQSSQSSVESSPLDDGPEISPEVDPGASSPAEVPLPLSRSCSPPPSSEASNSASSSLSMPPLLGYKHPPDVRQPVLPKLALRVARSPKRSFDDSYQDAEDSQGEAKRSRSNLRYHTKLDIDPDADTPSLLASGSSAESSSSSASSPAPSPPPSMVVVPPTPIVSSKPLTRRQRKQLGLPKPRSTLLGTSTTKPSKGGAGKIIVPGGRYKKGDRDQAKASLENEGSVGTEWSKNGSGRIDVRGFKELKI